MSAKITSRRILIIDDEPTLRKLLARMMELEGYEVSVAPDRASGLRAAAEHSPDVVLCDVFLPDGNGVDMTGELRALLPRGEVILLTAHGNIGDGVQAIKNGAFDYITKGDDNRKIIPIVSRAMEAVRQRARQVREAVPACRHTTFEQIVGQSEPLRQCIAQARKVAVTDIPVLLCGETGTGKELFAEAIHAASVRAGRAFMPINCAAFSNDLLESELFGYKAGAFTGALREKKGLIEVADGGTLFLDEIGEMALPLQAKLLRVLESGEYIKVGDTQCSRADVRIISATNRNLTEEIAHGRFREDLFYRLSVFQINLPPLRERKGDIALMAEFFMRKFSEKMHKPVRGMRPEFLAALENAPWRGNIRELRNVLERGLTVCDDWLTAEDLPLSLQRPAAPGREEPADTLDMASIERRHIRRVLERTGGNKTAAARLLKIGLTTLYRKIEEYGLQ